MALTRRPFIVAAVLVASLLAGWVMVGGSGAGIDADLSRHTRPVAVQAPSIGGPPTVTPPGGTAGEHIPPEFTAIVCPRLLAAAALITQRFNALIAVAPPQLVPILIAARDSALAQINAQLNAFHCVASPG